jgi:two-component SAPR family response regulator
MDAELQNWIGQGRFEQAVMGLENEILQGRDVEALLRMLPANQLNSSPLLLKACGQYEYRHGRLTEAKMHFAQAVKGLTAQTFHRPLLSAMALWADCLLRTGELDQAETLLRFLSEEYKEEAKSELDGEVPYVLARGARLLDRSLKVKPLLLDAWNAFIRDNRKERVFLSLELLIDEMVQHDPALELTVYMHLQKWANADSRFECCLEWAEAIRLLKQERWSEAAQLLKGLPFAQLPYRLAAAAELQLAGALQASGDDPAFAQLADLDRLQMSHSSDWELQLAVRRAKYEGFRARGREREAQQALKEQAAIADMLRLSDRDKEREMEVAPEAEIQPVQPQNMDALAAHNFSHSIGQEAVVNSSWRIQCLGGLQLSSQGITAPAIAWKRKKAKELFIYLLLEPNYAAGKEQVAEVLLSEDDVEGAIKHLYVIVHQLKKALQTALNIDNGIMIRDERVRLNPSMIEFVDVEQYLNLIRVADQLWLQDRVLAAELYLQAYTMYDQLLPELPYLEWLERRREYLLEKQTFILHKLGILAEKDRLFEQAESYYREWIELRPYQEDAYQCLLRLLVFMGRRKEAERWYKVLEEMCHVELNTAPTEETKRIVTGY